MAKYQLLLPKMGESVAEATIIKWNKKPGDYIEADEAVMEIATDKVDSEVPSPVSGKLVEQLCKEDEVVQVGSVIAIIETDTAANETTTAPVAEVKAEPVPQAVAATPEPQATQPAKEEEAPQIEQIPGISQLANNSNTSQNTGVKFENRFYSPLVKNIAHQEGIDNDELDRIPGTGAEGRLTKDDLLTYLQSRGTKPAPVETYAIPQAAAKPAAPPVMASAAPTPQAAPVTQPTASQPAYTAQQASAPSANHNNTPVTPPAPQPVTPPVAEPVKETPKPVTSVSGGDEIIEMDRMRKLIAEHMVYSKHTSPHVTSFVEADVTGLVQWRDKVKDGFEKREGEKITFTPIFIEAVVRAIKDFPMINVTVSGTQIIKKRDINISMATALPSGNLIVPVIKRADQLSLLGITKAVNDLANRARINKLLPDDVKDGTFTITNVGSFGNVMGTPIINQPQVAILAVGAIKKKVAVLETPEGDTIAIRHMMFLSLSYDHRVVDGALGGRFIRKIADYLENWDLTRNI
ncbi:2-oxo acid dehydrogenase subunit E2 [Inquilinus sp. KBS0705]|nr:2-oxo acid dehydrogenase subunit E2 [Inquilinus sp. KBS0705]